VGHLGKIRFMFLSSNNSFIIVHETLNKILRYHVYKRISVNTKAEGRELPEMARDVKPLFTDGT
jgi:hypothetical protein